MTLIKCPDCSKQISDKSNSCLHCGYPLTKPLPAPWATSNPPYLPDPFPENKPSKPKARSYGCGTFILVILISYFVYQCGNSYSDYKDRARNASNSSNVNTSEKKLKQENELMIKIPMSDAHENNRYFIISRLNKNGIEKIKYLRRGNESDIYGKMDINCSRNKIRKNSTEDATNLESLDLGDWLTPSPDWTDKDIMNFICQ